MRGGDCADVVCPPSLRLRSGQAPSSTLRAGSFVYAQGRLLRLRSGQAPSSTLRAGCFAPRNDGQQRPWLSSYETFISFLSETFASTRYAFLSRFEAESGWSAGIPSSHPPIRLSVTHPLHQERLFSQQAEEWPLREVARRTFCRRCFSQTPRARPAKVPAWFRDPGLSMPAPWRRPSCP
jgi:hypothetical protein